MATAAPPPPPLMNKFPAMGATEAAITQWLNKPNSNVTMQEKYDFLVKIKKKIF